MSYTFQANIYNERVGSQFGRRLNITVQANNKNNAYKETKKLFNNYVCSLNFYYNIDAKGKIRKTINIFNYDNLKLV